MKQVASLLLIPLILLSQGLFYVSHTHAGTSTIETEGHAASPHIHLHHTDQHDHHHDGINTQPSSDEHDSVAVYTGDLQLLNDCKVVQIADIKSSIASAASYEFATGALNQNHFDYQQPPILLHLSCPTFLQLLSIRC